MKSHFQLSYTTPDSIALKDLTYVVIGAREGEKWIFVRHKERSSWELPAGHIEKNESAMEAAKRELFEETGTLNSAIRAIFDYTVNDNGEVKHGRLFFARVIDRGPIPESEIAEIKIQKTSPTPASHM